MEYNVLNLIAGRRKKEDKVYCVKQRLFNFSN